MLTFFDVYGIMLREDMCLFVKEGAFILTKIKSIRLISVFLCIAVVLMAAAGVIYFNTLEPAAAVATETPYTWADFDDNGVVAKIFGQTYDTSMYDGTKTGGGNVNLSAYGGGSSVAPFNVVGGLVATIPYGNASVLRTYNSYSGTVPNYVYGLIQEYGNAKFTLDGNQIFCFDYMTHFDGSVMKKFDSLAEAGILAGSNISEESITNMAKAVAVLTKDNFKFLKDHASDYARPFGTNGHINVNYGAIEEHYRDFGFTDENGVWDLPIKRYLDTCTTPGHTHTGYSYDIISQSDVAACFAAEGTYGNNARSYLIQYMIWMKLHGMEASTSGINPPLGKLGFDGSSWQGKGFRTIYSVGSFTLYSIVDIDKMYSDALAAFNTLFPKASSGSWSKSYVLDGDESVEITGNDYTQIKAIMASESISNPGCDECLSVTDKGTSLLLTAKKVDSAHSHSLNTGGSTAVSTPFGIYSSSNGTYRNDNKLMNTKGDGDGQFTIFPISTDAPLASSVSVTVNLTEKKDATVHVTKSVPDGFTPTGAVYTVYNNSACTSSVGTATINSSGTGSLTVPIDSCYEDNGKYYVWVKETKAPTAALPADVYWVMDSNTYMLEMKEDQTSYVTSKNYVTYHYGYVQVHKKVKPAPDDSMTYSPQGAVYKVYSSKSTSGTPLGTLTIGEDGYSGTLKVAWGQNETSKTVYIQESSGPTTGLPANVEWDIDTSWHTVTVTSNGDKPGDVVVVESTDSLDYNYGYVQVHKTVVPAEADYLEGNYSPEGAVYGVYSNSGCTSLLGRLTIGADGYSGTLKVGWNKGETGKTVYIKEISTPTVDPSANSSYEWVIDTNVYAVTVTNPDNTKTSEVFTSYSGNGVVEYGYFQLQKITDPGCVNLVDNNGLYTLSGTRFNVVGLKGTDTASYNTTLTTGANGLTSIVKVKVGTYTATEITQPSGYQSLDKDNLLHTFTFEVHLNNIYTNPVIKVFANKPASDPLDITLDKDWTE